ncbi:MAG: glycosyltransferase [Bacteroidales bacterium]|jgi:glycosyltransferase involved in cell wall biosynthesis|nr:glycosyltransferase [Bacteroidales bacterium]
MLPTGCNSPLVSILIPLYNAQNYIEEAIQSCFRQTYKNIEVVIVDDHSTDASLLIAKQYESARLKVFSNPRKGANAARNFAFEHAQGEYIKFMDADDYCSDTMVENQLQRLLSDGANDTLIFSPVKMLYPDGYILEPARTIDNDFEPGMELAVAIWRGGGFNCPHCHLMHKDLVKKAGGWDESIIKNQDGEFFIRVASCASKALSVSEDFGVWRQTGSGVSSKVTPEALTSVVKTYRIISALILKYKNSEENRVMCAKRIGGFVYEFYPFCKPVFPEVFQLLHDLKQPLLLPERRMLKYLRCFLGWQLALKIIHRFSL